MPFAVTTTARPAVLGLRARAPPRPSASRRGVTPITAICAPERSGLDAYKSPDGGYDLVSITRDAYKAFNSAGKEGLPLEAYWAEDAVLSPAYPVPGWQKADGLQSILAQFGSFPEYETFVGCACVPYDFVRADNKVFVFEELSSDVMEPFKGLAVHTFNEAGQCVATSPYHDPRAEDYSVIRAKAVVAKAYELFAAGDLEALAALHAPGFEATWVGADGPQKYGSCVDVASVIMSQGWPTFRFEPAYPLEMLSAEGNRVLTKMHAVTDNGMDCIFAHLWEVDLATGRLKSAHFFDDSLAWANTRESSAQ